MGQHKVLSSGVPGSNHVLVSCTALQFVRCASALDGISSRLQLEGDPGKLRTSLKGHIRAYLRPIAGRDTMLLACSLAVHVLCLSCLVPLA